MDGYCSANKESLEIVLGNILTSLWCRDDDYSKDRLEYAKKSLGEQAFKELMNEFGVFL